jgi:hypothetical protein
MTKDKLLQAVRNMARFIHASRWKGPRAMSKKQLRRFNYWERVSTRLSLGDKKFSEVFIPRPPRGKRKKIRDAWLQKQRGIPAWIEGPFVVGTPEYRAFVEKTGFERKAKHDS